jgi:hypothetical protein
MLETLIVVISDSCPMLADRQGFCFLSSKPFSYARREGCFMNQIRKPRFCLVVALALLGLGLLVHAAASTDPVADCETASGTRVCILTYAMVLGNGHDGGNWSGANMRIRDTFLGFGDGTWAMGHGMLKVRVPSNGASKPAAGPAEILYYENRQRFTNDAPGATVKSNVWAFCPVQGHTNNTMALARGDLIMSATPTISWRACTFPAGYNSNKEAYTPDVVGTGEGCLQPYRSVGKVFCSGWACSLGDLKEGDNPQDETWEQALNDLIFSADFSTFSMPFMLVPNRNPSRTSRSWEGSLTHVNCQ